MGSNLIFIDTSMFYALVDENDDFHKQALQIWQKQKLQKIQLITSNYILDETFTLIRQRRGRKVVDEFRKNLLSEIKIIRVTVADEAGAWGWFLQDWSDLSFTDCVSFALMKRLEIGQALTFDNHFKRAGYKLISL